MLSKYRPCSVNRPIRTRRCVMVNNRYSQHYVDEIRNGTTLLRNFPGEILCENVCNALLERSFGCSNFVMTLKCIEQQKAMRRTSYSTSTL